MDPVTIHVAPNRFEAETVVAFLAAHDIDAIVTADDAGGTGPNLAFVQGIRVVVAAASADEARDLLRETSRSRNVRLRPRPDKPFRDSWIRVQQNWVMDRD